MSYPLGSIVLDGPRSKLLEEMAPLKTKLAALQRDPARRASAADLPGVEVIASPLGLTQYRGQIRIDGGYRSRMLTKADELGMMTVADGPALQDSSRQKTFPPDGDKTSCVKM